IRRVTPPPIPNAALAATVAAAMPQPPPSGTTPIPNAITRDELPTPAPPWSEKVAKARALPPPAPQAPEAPPDAPPSPATPSVPSLPAMDLEAIAEDIPAHSGNLFDQPPDLRSTALRRRRRTARIVVAASLSVVVGILALEFGVRLRAQHP